MEDSPFAGGIGTGDVPERFGGVGMKLDQESATGTDDVVGSAKRRRLSGSGGVSARTGT